MGAESAVKIRKWGQKAPPKWQSDGKKRRHSNRDEKSVVEESAPKTAKWWQKVPPLLKCGGTKRWFLL